MSINNVRCLKAVTELQRGEVLTLVFSTHLRALNFTTLSDKVRTVVFYFMSICRFYHFIAH